jgi:hypothetical protein
VITTRSDPHPESTTDTALLRTISETAEFRFLRSLRTRHVATEPRRWDRYEIGVGVAAAALSIAACVYFVTGQGVLGYGDTYSHLEISRRVVTGSTTGIAQLGTIWLPLPHILQALFAWNSTLYRTGLAGAFVSMTAFVFSTVMIYRIVRVFSPNRVWPAIAAAAVFMTNPNILYHQTTAMDELPFYAFALAATYGLVRWADTRRPKYLLEGAVASMLAMLCRYEGWFLAGAFTVAVLVMARKAGYSWRDVRGLTVMFAAFGALTASVGWMIFNLLVTGSPVNFLVGPNSSADQMSRQSHAEIGSWSNTLRAYSGVLIADHGILVLVAGVAGLIFFVVAERFSARSLPLIALTTIVPFYIATIEGGQEPIEIPPVNEHLGNLRFGLVAALPFALMIGYALARVPSRVSVAAAVLATTGLVILSANAFRTHELITVEEASQELAVQSTQAATGDFLQHHTTGPILVDLVGNERLAFPVLDRVIYEGTRRAKANVWTSALRDPRAIGATVVVMREVDVITEDRVRTALKGKPAMAPYRIVFTTADYTVYQLGP